MATNRGLRSTDLELASARQQFIDSINKRKQFDEECATIIPVLKDQWNNKIIVPFNLPYTEEIEVGTIVPDGTKAGLAPLRQTQEGVNWINWRHYLYNYDPFLLQKAISRLASRMELDADGSVKNARGPIVNVPAYFKSLVQDLRIKQLNPRKRRGQAPAGPVVDDNVECEECFDEYGSRACLRPAHLRAKAGL